MALLDVTEVLEDDDFTDAFFLMTKTQKVGVDGIARETESAQIFGGVCFPGSGNKLVRTPDGERVEADMSIVTKAALHDGRGAEPAATVEYMGQRYTVFYVDDYQNWGAGFVHAHCMLETIRG